MTESVAFGRLVLGVVVVIGEELCRCADNGKMNSHSGKARVEAVSEKGIGNVFAIPSQEKIHAVNSRSGCVADGGGGQDAAANQFGGEDLNLLVEVEEF